MKQIILGDTHGRDTWKQILLQENEWDRVIFIGDYFDTHEDITPETQMNVVSDIIQFKKDNPDKVILLVGNHDYHYWPGVTEDYSGYQPQMRASFEYILDSNKKLFQMCFVDEYDTVYSHAGFTETFVEQRIGTFSERQVNDVWKYKPQSFAFYPMDRSHCGDDIHQGCLWVRPQSLYRDSISKLQVVGHTQVNNINHPAKSERRGFYMIDAIGSRQYLVRKDSVFEIGKLPPLPPKKYEHKIDFD